MSKRKAEEEPLASSRPRRASAAATTDKIQASLKTEKAAAIVISDDDDEDQAPVQQSKARKSSGSTSKGSKSSGSTSKAPVEKKPNINDDHDDFVLLGHIVSKCVGIQHYRGNNGVRYAKEPLRLKREPQNPYDSNAVAVHAMPSGAKVGHVQRGDAIAIAKVADDPAMTILMVGQVERGADNVYGFPLRISFFGRPTVPSSGGLPTRTRVNRLLAPSTLVEPKRRGGMKAAGLQGMAASAHGGERAQQRSASAAADTSGISKSAGKAAAAAAVPDDDDDDDVEVTGEKTWAERDAELRAQAVVLE